MLYIRCLICLVVITCALSFKCKKPKTEQICKNTPTILISADYSTKDLLNIIDDKPLCVQTELNYSPNIEKYNNIPFSDKEIIAEAPINNYFDDNDKKLPNNTYLINLLQTAGINKALSAVEKLFIGKSTSLTQNNQHSLLATWYSDKEIVYKQHITANNIEILNHKSVKIWVQNYALNKFVVFEKQSNSYELDKSLEQIIYEKSKSMPIGTFNVKIKPNIYK